MVHQENWGNYCQSVQESKPKDILFKISHLEREKVLRNLNSREDTKLERLKAVAKEEFGLVL